jgi:hypothetical protein
MNPVRTQKTIGRAPCAEARRIVSDVHQLLRLIEVDGMNPVRAKYFIKDKICRFTIGSKAEL